jgi:hypothetical protein
VRSLVDGDERVAGWERSPAGGVAVPACLPAPAEQRGEAVKPAAEHVATIPNVDGATPGAGRLAPEACAVALGSVRWSLGG